jgi:hypothetical protein
VVLAGQQFRDFTWENRMSISLQVEAAEAALAKSGRAEAYARAGIVVAMFSAVALNCMWQSPGSDPDIWWHLRAAEWILQHRAFPHTDPFSRLGPGHSWQAYSWLFDIVVYWLFRWFGLAGILAYSTALMLAITAALYRLMARLQPDFTIAVLLTFAGAICMERLHAPRSWLCSILFFILQLDILDKVRRDGRSRRLLWLLPIYALWANIHIQFIDGLVVLAAAAIEPLLLPRWWPRRQEENLFPRSTWLAFAGCVAAICLNPYGIKIYRMAYELALQQGVLDKVNELLAMPFRDWSDFLILGLTLAAVAALSWQRRFPVWPTLLLGMGVFLSFRSQRDIWFVVVVACMVLASELRLRWHPPSARVRFSPALVPASTALVIVIGGLTMHLSNARLAAKMEEDLPVRAVETILEKRYPGPVYNNYNWGGYLIWALRMPVAIDGRAALYGDQRIDRSVATWMGEPNWASDPQLTSSTLIVAPVKSPLTQLLRVDAAFHLVYEDKVAAVFTRN